MPKLNHNDPYDLQDPQRPSVHADAHNGFVSPVVGQFVVVNSLIHVAKSSADCLAWSVYVQNVVPSSSFVLCEGCAECSGSQKPVDLVSVGGGH